MSESLTVHGFGSLFRGQRHAKDVDLLLLHQSTDPASCHFAIRCKAHLQRVLPDADIVLLSQGEAQGNQFLARAKAVVLGTLFDGDIGAQVQALVRQIESRSSATDESSSDGISRRLGEGARLLP